MSWNLHLPASALCALGLLCGAALPARAQMTGGALNPANPIGATPRLHNTEPEEAPPPALPGVSGTETNPLSQVQIDNEDPTKVLFSAINDGNYAEARAAISRGANLSAKNILSETPIEMSVALNRNNITFMLLSMRAAEGGGSGAPGGAPGPAAGSSPASVLKVGNPVHMRAKRLHPFSPAMPQDKPAPSPGVPDPAAGFLGFNGAS